MYKTFEGRDFILWQTGMNMTWRNMENSCANSWPFAAADDESTKKVGSQVGPDTVNTLVFMYTWPSNQDELTYGGVPAAEFMRRGAAKHGTAQLAL